MLSLTSRSEARPARRLPLVALYTANAVSQTGDMLMLLAVPWFVLQTTGSITKTGITAFFSTAAIGLSALFGGAIVDRIGLRRASVASDLASALCVALVPLLYLTVGLPFWALLALVFLAGLLTTPGQTARSALIPDLAQLARARLERVTAATDSVTRLARFAGAPLAGVLIAIVGTSNLLFIDAVTFAFSAIVIGTAIPVRMPVFASGSAQFTEHSNALLPSDGADAVGLDTAERPASASGYLAGMREGITFLWRDRVLRDITIVVFITNLLDAGQAGVLAPAFVKQVYGNPVVLGAMVAAFGGAAFASTLVFGAIGHKLPRRLTFSLCFMIGGASRFFWMVLLAPVPVAMIISLAICGFFIGPINPLFNTFEYERVPVELRARVFGTVLAGSMLGLPLGGLLAGVLAPVLSVEPTMLLFGVIYSVTTLSLLVNPTLRSLNTRPSLA